MGIKQYKPYTPTRRFTKLSDFSELTTSKPFKSLTKGKKRINGRNNLGRITVRHRGAGVKRAFRIIDFARDKWNVPGTVETVEYDPNRTSRICLVKYADGARRYILAPENLNVGDSIIAGDNVPLTPGNCSTLRNIPEGTPIHNVEIMPGRMRGQMVRSAGTSAVIKAKEGNYAFVELPSKELRKFHLNCKATIGIVSNSDHSNIVLGKAGRSRWMGRRPKVRGVAMNAVDHPHGGGRGKQKGYKMPVSPTGVPAKGVKTRSKNKYSDQWIVRKRKKRGKK
ncbi:50S ribosomal protein L2 [bacterium]|nr:50S ribosomal protein L2 [bacterium]